MKLVNFLKKLRSEQVSVELKNGTTVWGTLQTVSPQMNVTLTDVKLSLPRNGSRPNAGNATALSSMYLADRSKSNSLQTVDDETVTYLQYINIRGNTIRQIILPDSVNLDNLLVDDQQLKKLRRAGKVVDDSNRKRKREFGQDATKRVRRGV